MRAFSPHGNYSIQLVEAVPKKGTDQAGNVVEYSDTKPIIAQFERSGLMVWEEQAVLEAFNFSGLAEGVHPLSTVGVYDSELAVQYVADKSEREAKQKLIDARLSELQKMFPSQYIIVEKPALPAPWPTYDATQDFEDVLTVMQATGVSPQTVRLYESENENRPEFIEALEALEAEALATGITVSL
jgi:hypothetical protein